METLIWIIAWIVTVWVAYLAGKRDKKEESKKLKRYFHGRMKDD